MIEIAAIGDCGFSKRSYNTNYNANSGCAVIIGLKSKKILYIDIKNKYCSLCCEGVSLNEHICYKNWSGSSSSMESSIICEGFNYLYDYH